jgi:hypothetical protein
MDRDAEHLRLLSIFYYVWAGLTAVFSCFPLIYLVIGLVFMLSPEEMGGNGEEMSPAAKAAVGWTFVAFGGCASLLGWASAVCNVLVGHFLKQRRHYIFCLVMAGWNCMSVPLGTVLGVFTFIVLTRDSVKNSFDSEPAFVEPL